MSIDQDISQEQESKIVQLDSYCAIVDGKPVFELPLDLYIPPEALLVFLDMFEGPLDFLLYLIRRSNIDILNIPVARVTTQYLKYIQVLSRQNFELASQYLVMAAVLIDIKSRFLLPRSDCPALEEEGLDPRAQLIRSLINYERIKLAAVTLREAPHLGRDFFLVQVISSIEEEVDSLPGADWECLQSAWHNVLKRLKGNKEHVIVRESYSVRERMSSIMRLLQTRRVCLFDELFDTQMGLLFLIVSFLAILELARDGCVSLHQDVSLGALRVSYRS